MKPYFLLALAILLVACEPADDGIHGYVEGEFVMVAPTSAGILETLSVERGEDVDAGAPLFSLDLTDLTAQRDRAAADLWRAQAELEARELGVGGGAAALPTAAPEPGNRAAHGFARIMKGLLATISGASTP